MLKYLLRLLPPLFLCLLAAPERAGQVVRGGGATFPYPIYSKWIESFQRQHPEFAIQYQAVGSEAGIRRLVEGSLDFAGSDMPLSDGQMASQPFPVLHFPTVIGAVVPIYKIPGLTEDLRLTPGILAGIFLGKITKWSDPAIKAVNRGIHLPEDQIVVVHRSDGSGTSYVWTDYLSKLSPEWKGAVGCGTTVAWPTGIGAEGNEGVAQRVRETPNSLGYVEFIYALQNHLSYGLVQNKSGRFVQASLASLNEAAAGAADRIPADFRLSITDAPGPHAYPIAAFTYLLVPAHVGDTGKRTAITEFLRWLLISGQRQSPALGYGMLPEKVVARAQKAIERIQ